MATLQGVVEMAEKVKARCNWTQTAGNELSKLTPTRLYDDDIFVKPDLDDVVNAERAVLFSNNNSPATPCEVQFEISPRFKIAAITIVVSAPKVELFLGSSQEYSETIYGEAIEEDNSDAEITPYRYDIEIDRSGIASVNLKLLTSSSSNEICIFGVMLHIAPNPNGITTELPRPINLERMQELFKSTGGQKQPDDNDQKFQQFMSLLQARPTQSEPVADTNTNDILSHIDTKFRQLEQVIEKRLNDFQAKQNEKLDKLIALLEH